MTGENMTVPIESLNGSIRVVDDEGHLLFIYNPHTRQIEFIPVRAGKREGGQKKKCFIDVELLRSLGARNVISEDPIHEVIAEVRDARQDP